MSTPPITYYVAPYGNDLWTGRIPEADGVDGPFATLARAKQAIGSQPERGAPVTISLRGGTHLLAEPLVFGPRDSGLSKSPVTWEAYPGERPVISGGRLLTGWQPTTVNGMEAWVTDAPDLPVRQLFVNGERRQRPRLPKTGFFRIAGLPDYVSGETPWHQGQTEFTAAPGDMRAWKNITDVEVVALARWVESRLPVVSVDETTGLVRTGMRSVFSLIDVSEERDEEFCRYYVENVFEALDTPGEWYLDREAGKMYYLPLPGEDPATAEVIAPYHAQVIRLEGEADAGAFVEQLTFRGLTFSHTEWRVTPGTDLFVGGTYSDKCGDAQAAVSVPGAIYTEGARDCRFERCTIAHVGTYGIELGRGCRGNVIAACELFDLGAGGVKLGTRAVADALISGDNTVTDCHIHDGGVIFHSAIGVWMGQTGGNTIAHNHIHDFYYSGISVGWTWGYGESGTRDNLFAYNHIHDIGKGWLSDMGGIYTLGAAPGTVIRHNCIHHVESYGYGGWALYHDEGSTGILSENNLTYRCKSSSFHQHYGKENYLRNNIFALARVAQLAVTKEEEHLNIIVEGNIVYFDSGELFPGQYDKGAYRFDRNLYWDASGRPLAFAGMPFAEWQAKGQDTHSLIADPQFADPEHHDFTLAENSPARAIGFVPFDLSLIGPRGPVGA